MRQAVTGGLTLFPGTPLLEEANRGKFDMEALSRRRQNKRTL